MNRKLYFRNLSVFYLLVVLSGLFLFSNSATAQPGHSQIQDRTIDSTIRNAVLEEAIKNIKENYVFAEMGDKVAADIQSRMKAGEYDKITSGLEFAKTLTANMQAISKDKHMYLRLLSGSSANPFTPERARAGNFGFSKAEILQGNIGYLKINEFPPADMVAPTLAAAMKFLSNTDALIIDLREHRGGSVHTVAMTVSYFIPEKRIQLLTVSSPRTGLKNESWTLEKVEGPRYLDKPVYLLTSSRTFSGGEEFAYDMQALKRATLIGETTGGGANPVRLFPLQNIFVLGVSQAQVTNTITGTNWEGKGVKPEIETPVEQALQKAQELAIKQIQEKQNKQPVAQAQTQTTAPAGELKFPDTRAGKTFASFLKALNSGDLATMKSFHVGMGNEAAAEENSKQDLGFYQHSGGVIPHSIIETSEYSITLLVKTKKDGEWLKLKIALQQSAPFGIASLSIQPSSEPSSIK